MESISINQAMKEIKHERCCKCGRQAKGLVYRGQVANYYCKKCLHEHMQQKEFQVEEAVASPA